MTKLRCPECGSILLGKAGQDEWECNICGFSGYSKDFDCSKTKLYRENKPKEKIFNPSLRVR